MPPFITKDDFFSGADVFQGIAGDGDDVGILSHGEIAAVGDAEQVGGVERTGAKGFEGRHAAVRHGGELFGIFAEGHEGRVGAKRDLHPRESGFPQVGTREGEDGLGLTADGGRQAGKVDCLGEGGGGYQGRCRGLSSAGWPLR